LKEEENGKIVGNCSGFGQIEQIIEEFKEKMESV